MAEPAPDNDPMPELRIQADNALAPDLVYILKMLCIMHGRFEHAAEVQQDHDRIVAWQRRNPDRVKLPECQHQTVTPAP